MSKHLHGGNSASKVAYYAAYPNKKNANKKKRLLRHLKKNPLDKQTKEVVEKL